MVRILFQILLILLWKVNDFWLWNKYQISLLWLMLHLVILHSLILQVSRFQVISNFFIIILDLPSLHKLSFNQYSFNKTQSFNLNSIFLISIIQSLECDNLTTFTCAKSFEKTKEMCFMSISYIHIRINRSSSTCFHYCWFR